MPSTQTLTAHACSIHNRVYVTTLQTWLPLTHSQVEPGFAAAPWLEAACDLCLLISHTLFRRQFPELYRAHA
jgi:hypothetical protein